MIFTAEKAVAGWPQKQKMLEWGGKEKAGTYVSAGNLLNK